MSEGAFTTEEDFVGVGRLAAELGVCESTVRLWEQTGLVPRAARIAPRSTRVWPVTDLASIRERVAAKRAAGRQHGGRVSVA
ncbi:MAG: hypothetical protein M3Q03_00805 [Chloroflexota bacterium]|nr:hypothetical protein [Chloroflexota bacterium]